MTAVHLPDPKVGLLQSVAPYPLRLILNWGRRYSLWVFNFGLACCAIEFISASMARHDFIRLGVIPFAHGPRQADLMIVSGTVTDKMAPAVRRLWEQMPEPKYVISFGACSNSGGPYSDSYCVTKGVDQVIPVDVYVPGCPPRPEALLQGIVKLQEKIAGENLGRRYSARRRASAGAVTRGLVPPPALASRSIPAVDQPPAEKPVAATAPEPAGPPPVMRAEPVRPQELREPVVEFEPVFPVTGPIPTPAEPEVVPPQSAPTQQAKRAPRPRKKATEPPPAARSDPEPAEQPGDEPPQAGHWWREP